jgi:hypothetical protein
VHGATGAGLAAGASTLPLTPTLAAGASTPPLTLTLAPLHCRTSGSATRGGRGAAQATRTTISGPSLRTPTLERMRVSCGPAQRWRSSWRAWHRIAVSAPANSAPTDASPLTGCLPALTGCLPALAVLFASDDWLQFCGFALNEVVGKTTKVRLPIGSTSAARSGTHVLECPPHHSSTCTQILQGPATETDVVEQLEFGGNERCA